MTEPLYTDTAALSRARDAWHALAPMRRTRARCKAFAYGRQWGDPCRTTDGRTVSEQQRMSEEGRLPITNNIIRQMLKSIVGRYRSMCQPPGPEGEVRTTPFSQDPPAVSDTDARALEEFLISGVAAQRLHWEQPGQVLNISPSRLFYRPFMMPGGEDCRLVGMLHSLTRYRILRMFSRGDPRRARALDRAISRAAEMPGGISAGDTMFDTPLLPGHIRVVESWECMGRQYLRVSDPAGDKEEERPLQHLEMLEGLNRARAEVGTPPLHIEHAVEHRWVGTWMLPGGTVLQRTVLEAGEKPPVALRLYPLIDGEVHSLVEDVIDQQKYINRLISILDHIIGSSAKGVLLYPAEQLPDGFTWRDLRRIWANPTGILPFKRGAKGTLMPQQVTTSGASGAGATEMLKMQLQLFDQISGATGAMRGNSHSAMGEGMYRAELENTLVSMLDILSCFRNFIMDRNKLLEK